MIRIFTLLSLFVLLLLSDAVLAQSDTINWYHGKKLTTHNFKINRSLPAHLAINVTYEYQLPPNVFTGKVKPFVSASAVFTISESTLPDSTSESLRFAQLQFDLAGYHTKLIKYRAYELGNSKGTVPDTKKKLDDIFFQIGQEISKLDKELSQSLFLDPTPANFVKWENKIADLIVAVPEVNIENHELNFLLGIYLGVSHHFLTSTTKDHFSNPTALNFGFNIDSGKSRFSMDLAIGGNKTRKEIAAKGTWPSGLKTTLANFEFTYGRKFRKERWLLVPYAGLGINEFSPRKFDKEDKRSLVGYSPVIGIELNNYFRNTEDSFERVFFFYRLRFSVNPTNFLRSYEGAQFNMKLAAGFDVTRLKRRMAIKK